MHTVLRPDEEMERIKSAAEMLRVKTDTLRGWCKDGRVRYHRLGAKLIMIPRSEISRLIRESKIV